MRRLSSVVVLIVLSGALYVVFRQATDLASLDEQLTIDTSRLLDLVDTAATPAPAPSVVGAPEENPIRGRWRMHEGRSPMDDSPTVVLSLPADGSLTNPVGRAVTPTLHVRCLESTTEVFVETGVPSTIEFGSGGTSSVRVRVDDGPARRQNWIDSTDRLAFFAPDAIPLARRLASARTLRWEFTGRVGGRQIVEFDVRGLDALLPDVAEACGWTV